MDVSIEVYSAEFCRALANAYSPSLASAISAAAALREETGFFVMEDMERLYPQIRIEKIG